MTKALGNLTLTHDGTWWTKKKDSVLQIVMIVLWKTLQIDVRRGIYLECSHLHLN